jgi:hypothetical protein
VGEKPRRYVSYLLRLWQTQSDGELVWPASLEDPHTGKRRGFGSLADLFAYLEQETAPGDDDKPESSNRDELDI